MCRTTFQSTPSECGLFDKICTRTAQPYRILHQIVGCIWQDLCMYSAALQDSPPDCGVHLARFVHVQCSLTGFSTRLLGAFGKICTCTVQPYRILHQTVGCIWQDLYLCSTALQEVVDRRIYTRIFQFPLRINVKISEHAQNFNVFKPRLVCRRILILPSGSSGNFSKI